MKRFYIHLLAIFACLGASAQDVSFQFSDGIDNKRLKEKMESQLSALLTAINTAAANNTDINYSGIDIDPLASQSIGMTWRVVHFATEEDDIVEHCLRQKNSAGNIRGYQVRNIGVRMMSLNQSYDGPEHRELAVDFSPSGQIEDVNFSMGSTEYAGLMREGHDLGDLDRRMQIIHWCEQFQNAYNKCDINFLENIFSDDAIIITGKLKSRRVRSDIAMVNPTNVEYVRQNKAQYLNGLRRVFANNKYINVKFTDYKIKRHPSKPYYYGVTLIQDWATSSYKDQGIVFLLWDFSDEDAPKIHVRTWQPITEEPFSINDFKLPRQSKK